MKDGDITSLLKEQVRTVQKVLIVDDINEENRATLKRRVADCLPCSKINFSQNGFHNFVSELVKREGRVWPQQGIPIDQEIDLENDDVNDLVSG